MPLTIYRSSAGSGKTFTLVKEYLKLILKRPKDFQHILAITFTNKATGEMKTRILDSLQQISEGKHTDIFGVLKEELKEEIPEGQLQKRAAEAYERIIHNYSRFEVSTIDSFFSRVVRSFSKELGIPLSYELEMNTALALEDAVDRLFQNISTNKDLRVWLEQYSFDQIENDRSWNIEGNIFNLGKNLFKEQFQEGFHQVKMDQKQLARLVSNLKKAIRTYQQALIKLAKEAISIIDKNGLSVSDFSYGASGAANTFYKIEAGQYELGSRFLKTAYGEASWVKKGSDKQDLIENLAVGRFGELTLELADYAKKYEKDYKTALALFKNIYAYGLLETLHFNLKEYRDQENIMLISDNNALIRELIRNDDAPFLFEKTGSFFKHILIDEFQDTSNFQWNNLLPLVLNSLASGYEVLIVGDVKQSIYRFRGGNMQLLLEKVGQDLMDFRAVTTYKNLRENYRSLAHIVTFNNAFFEALPASLACIEHVSSLSLIEKAYEGHQQTPKKEMGGYVKVSLFTTEKGAEEMWQEKALTSLVHTIRENLALGYDYGDFLVLVNQNNQMPVIAHTLLANNIPFVSERSLLLKNNTLVRFIIEALRFLQKEGDDVGMLNLVQLFSTLKGDKGQRHLINKEENIENCLKHADFPSAFIENRKILAQMPLYDLVSQLLITFQWAGQADVFIEKFQNIVLEQTQRGVHSLHAFLEWWDQQGVETTISSNEQTDAVKIMSVHKSKGLEAPVVIIPLADYSFLPNARLHTFWTDKIPEAYQDLAFVPLNYSKSSLVNTAFETAFSEETMESVLDALNKTYVAFTRAKEKLLITGPYQLPKSQAATHRIHHFLANLLSNDSMGMLKSELENAMVYEYGKNGEKVSASKTLEKVNEVNGYPASSYQQHLAIRPDADRFFQLQESEATAKITLGNQVHRALSLIKNEKAIDQVLNQLCQEGNIAGEEIPLIREKLRTLFENHQLRQWFHTDFEVLTEQEMTYEGQILRPDRVLVKGNQAIVIDYKKEKLADAHHRQVRKYMNAMGKMGYSRVKGYLVYVDLVEIQEVCL